MKQVSVDIFEGLQAGKYFVEPFHFEKTEKGFALVAQPKVEATLIRATSIVRKVKKKDEVDGDKYETVADAVIFVPVDNPKGIYCRVISNGMFRIYK